MPQNKLTLLSPFKITTADTDMHHRLRIGSLVNLLLQSAINSADNLGLGFENLNKQNLAWVLSRINVEIYKPIKWSEQIVVETWPKDLDKILYIRDFVVRNASGKIMAKATSGWLAIDIERRRPKVIEGSTSEIFSQLKEKHAIAQFPGKLMPVKQGDIFKNKARYSDIDLNQHVTATRYIDWMMDTFDIDFHKNNYPKKLVINYLKETLPTEILKLTRSNCENVCSFEGENGTSSTKAFRGLIEF
ncbi:MAG: thioesterase [Salinivirgaceae bacterium]|jgi:medium-chain acyl-[acyl-carrier-protein] hydrolase|nr:thioesterase [Salinivirgaceae bacterium]